MTAASGASPEGLSAARTTGKMFLTTSGIGTPAATSSRRRAATTTANSCFCLFQAGRGVIDTQKPQWIDPAGGTRELDAPGLPRPCQRERAERRRQTAGAGHARWRSADRHRQQRTAGAQFQPAAAQSRRRAATGFRAGQFAPRRAHAQRTLVPVAARRRRSGRSKKSSKVYNCTTSPIVA